MIPFTLIGGYLGAGKTTLLNHLLRNNDSRRIALLINDFGDVNIDGSLIESRSDQQINLTNGCVCCTLSNGFHEAIESLLLATPAPEHIIVEASGVADVKNLSQYGYAREFHLDGVLVVADAETVIHKANDKYVAQTVRRQLAAADVIILNKTDLIDEQQKAQVQTWLKATIPDSIILTAVKCELPVSLLLGVHHERDSSGDTDFHSHESYVSWSYQGNDALTEAQVMEYLHHLGNDVIRMKGMVILKGGGSLVVQQVGRRIDTHRVDRQASPGTRLVALGLRGQFRPDDIDRLTVRYLTPSDDVAD